MKKATQTLQDALKVVELSRHLKWSQERTIAALEAVLEGFRLMDEAKGKKH